MLDDKAKLKLRQLMEARERKDKALIEEKAAKKNLKEVEADVYDALRESGIVGAIKVDLGEPWGMVRFHTRTTDYADVIDDEKLLAWLKERGELEAYSRPELAKGLLNEYVRNLKEAGSSFPPGLSYRESRGVTVTRQKG